jgi:glutathione peroxidase
MNQSILALVAPVLLLGTLATGPAGAVEGCPAFLDHDFKKLRSRDSVNLCEAAAGKTLLVVNTASHCGFTPQFKGLEAIHQKYKDRGLFVVGFPSDDFKQEADTESETADVCFVNYGVTFTMLAPTSVKGEGANPVFQELGSRTEAPGWNFNKYLVSADGKVVQHFGSRVKPESEELAAAIEKLLD